MRHHVVEARRDVRRCDLPISGKRPRRGRSPANPKSVGPTTVDVWPILYLSCTKTRLARYMRSCTGCTGRSRDIPPSPSPRMRLMTCQAVHNPSVFSSSSHHIRVQGLAKLSAAHFFPPCSRVVEAAPDKAIVLPATGGSVGIRLREQDMTFENFLSCVNNYSR